MPAYKTHISVNLLVSFPLSIAALKWSVNLTPSELCAFSAAFIYGTLFLHPDLDLAKNIRIFSFKGLMTLPFRPLSFFSKHRGISHAPIFGTVLRAAWLLIILCVALSWMALDFNLWANPWIWLALAGLTVSDISHIVLDML